MRSEINFQAIIQRFGQMGEKTGWTYVIIPVEKALQLHDEDKKGFRVKGWLDECAIAQVALMPMGEGDYILPLNAAMRKCIRKNIGAHLQLRLSKDDSQLTIAPDLAVCLEDDDEAKTFFETLAASHQKYFSKYIEEAKTEVTRTKRLSQVMEGLSRKMDYGTMIRWGRKNR